MWWRVAHQTLVGHHSTTRPCGGEQSGRIGPLCRADERRDGAPNSAAAAAAAAVLAAGGGVGGCLEEVALGGVVHEDGAAGVPREAREVLDVHPLQRQRVLPAPAPPPTAPPPQTPSGEDPNSPEQNSMGENPSDAHDGLAPEPAAPRSEERAVKLGGGGRRGGWGGEVDMIGRGRGGLHWGRAETCRGGGR
jgi:hypothetical protein